MRAQLSLETLLVFLIFLSLLGISLASTSRIGSASQSKISAELSSSSWNELSSKIESACAGGNGNVRLVEMQGEKALLSSDGKELSFSASNFNATKTFACETVLLATEPSSDFRIENKEGAIEISQLQEFQ